MIYGLANLLIYYYGVCVEVRGQPGSVFPLYIHLASLLVMAFVYYRGIQKRYEWVLKLSKVLAGTHICPDGPACGSTLSDLYKGPTNQQWPCCILYF